MAELVREIVIDASPETIWPFLTDADHHVEWMGTVAEIDARPGGIHRVVVGGRSQAVGEYVEVVALEKIVYTFGWEQSEHAIPPGSTTVEITLHPEGDKTRVDSCTAACPTTRSPTTRTVGTTTSAASPSPRPVGRPDPTLLPRPPTPTRQETNRDRPPHRQPRRVAHLPARTARRREGADAPERRRRASTP